MRLCLIFRPNEIVWLFLVLQQCPRITYRSHFWTYLKVLSSSRSFVCLLPTFLGIGSFVFFWFLAQRCKMVMPKMWRSPIFEKKIFWANLGPKMPKNRVYWTLWKICSLVFPDFLYKDVEWKGPNCEKKKFSKKFFLGQFGPKNTQK